MEKTIEDVALVLLTLGAKPPMIDTDNGQVVFPSVRHAVAFGRTLDAVRTVIGRALAAEREACAKIVEDDTTTGQDAVSRAAIAAAIRARK